MKSLKLVTFSFIAVTTFVQTASAYYDRYEERPTYTVETVSRCDNQGRNAIIGGVLGGIAGAIIGGRNAGLGAGIGAIGGAAAGAVLSCKDQKVLVENVDQQLSREDYWNPYEDGRSRVIVVRSGYASNRMTCRTYYSEYRTRDGWIPGEYKTACWDGRFWVHNYSEEIIVREQPRTYVYPVWFRERPMYAERFRHERYERYERERREYEWERRQERYDGYRYNHISR